MKIPYSWIKEHIENKPEIQSYIKKMIMTGTAIDSYESAAQFTNVVVGKVLEVKDHENSDHLHVCKVDVGTEVLQIVCGAPNVKEDILVPVALVGAEMPGGFKIKKGKLRGVESNGMICSGPELNIPTYLYNSVGDLGILIFQEDYPLGTPVSKILELDDEILEFDILANRPDCLSIIGLAKESAAVLNTKFINQSIKVETIKENINDKLNVKIINTKDCPRYIARMIKNINIKESPMWIKSRLHKAGIRAINNIVDITNYVMLETGHPMHAFDLDKLKGNTIYVKSAENDTKFTTLDSKEYTLNSNDLCICDESGPVGLAGIMGGEISEIDSNTKNVVFECAVFNKATIRKTARRLGIRTESSGRFEKGVSVNTAEYAINRACQLVNMLNTGEVLDGNIDVYNNKSEMPCITTSVDYINKRTGIQLDVKTICDILKRLGFSVANTQDTISAIAPPHRQDIENEADLCEEVLRIYGYDNLASTPLRGATTQGQINENMRVRNKVANILRANSYFEIMNYSFVSKKNIEKLNLDSNDIRSNPIQIMNPLGEDTAYMRTSLVPSILSTVSLNISRGNLAVNLFESSKVFYKEPKTEEGLPLEVPMISLASYGDNIDFYSMRLVCEQILDNMNIDYKIERKYDSYYHPGRSASLAANGEVIIKLGEIHPDIASNFEIDRRVYIAEIDLNLIMKYKRENTVLKELPKFPAVTRDLSIVFSDETEIGPVISNIKATCKSILEGVEIFDIYRGSQIDQNNKSVSFALTFRATDRTLTDEEIQVQIDKVLKLLSTKYNAFIRM